jgi:hypothetical protein
MIGGRFDANISSPSPALRRSASLHIRIENYCVANSTLWLWLFANPTSAHSNYATDKRAIKEMLTSSDEKK